MNKKYIIYIVSILIIFISGLFIGINLNSNGRFQTTDMSLTTDTKKGILYIFRGKDIVIVDLQTGDKIIKPLKN